MKLITLLIPGTFILIIILVRNYNKLSYKFIPRVGVSLLALLTISASMNPQEVSTLARYVGVGRGADLVLYATTLGFFGLTLLMVVKFNEIDERDSIIVREIAISELLLSMQKKQ